MMEVPLVVHFAVKHLLGRGRQSLVAIVGVAIGVGFSVAMTSLMQGSQEDFVRQLVDTMPHVQITDDVRTPKRQPAEDAFAAAEISNLHPKEDRRGIRNPTAVVAMLRAWIPGLMAVGLRTQGVLRYVGRDVGASIIGIEPKAEAAVSSVAGDFLAGGFSALATGGNNIVVGDQMARRLGAKMGSVVSVISSAGLTRPFKIVGIFHTGTTARDEGEAYVLLKNSQILSERTNAINDIRLRLNNPSQASAVAQRVEAQTGYKAVAWQEANESLLEALVVRNAIMYTVIGAIMLVSGFGIFNIVSTITHEKARDIAILKSLGFSEGEMRRLFLFEGIAIGSIGSLAGWALGLSLVFVLSQVHFDLSAVGREMTNLPLAWSFLHYLIAAGFALLSAGIAGYLPARRAARLNPVDIIRGAS